MDTSIPTQANLLLAALPATEYHRLLPQLRLVKLSRGEILYEGDSIPTAYFPTAGLVSLMCISLQDTETVVGLVSREGMVGIHPILSGASFEQATVQVEGHAWSIPSEELQEEFQRDGVLHHQILRHFQAILAQTSQSTLCNRLHSVEERLCRWLLAISDGLGENQFALEPRFLEQLLGRNYEVVTSAASMIQARGLIEHTPNRIAILNRENLERAACECYRVMRRERERLFSQPV